jgi:hypothetical protein
LEKNVGYVFEWDGKKAAANRQKHGVSFDEAMTTFSDPLSILLHDPDYSVSERRYLVLGMSNRRRWDSEQGMLSMESCSAWSSSARSLSRAKDGASSCGSLTLWNDVGTLA